MQSRWFLEVEITVFLSVYWTLPGQCGITAAVPSLPNTWPPILPLCSGCCNLEPSLRYIKVHFHYLCRTIAPCSLSASGNLDPEVGDLNKPAVCCYILAEDRNLQLLNSLLPVQFVSHSPGRFWSPSPAWTIWKREGANNDGCGLCFRWDCDYTRISCKWCTLWHHATKKTPRQNGKHRHAGRPAQSWRLSWRTQDTVYIYLKWMCNSAGEVKVMTFSPKGLIFGTVQNCQLFGNTSLCSLNPVINIASVLLWYFQGLRFLRIV